MVACVAEDNGLRGALDAVPVGIAVFDAAGRPTSVNRAAREVLGDLAVLPLDAWGHKARFTTHDGEPVALDLLPPLATLADGQPRRGAEIIVHGPAQASTEVLMSSEAVLDPTGLVVRVSLAITVLNQVRLGEESARRAAKVEAVATVARNLAGPYNDALTAIRGFCELALERLGPEHPVHGIVSEIRDAGRRAAVLTGRLLAFGAQEIPAPRTLRLERWLHEHEARIRDLAGHHIVVETKSEEGLGGVRVDPHLLEQIVVNLVANARDAMDGGGRLTIETKSVEIDPSLAPLLGADRPGRYGVVSIADTGGGMEDRVLPQVFVPFFTTKPGALGLGLATVDRLVRRQGGFLRVENRHGQGSTFHVHLPEVEAPVEVEDAGSRSIGWTGDHPLRVLIVEDDVVLRELLREVLEGEEMELLVASTATAASRIVEEANGCIDVLISDVVLPGESGDRLARRLLERCPDLRVLMISGCSDAARLAEVLGEQTPFLPKPFTPEALRSRLRDMLFVAA